MDSVLQLTPQQRSDLFIAAAQKSGIDVAVLEKDFWVCWTLRELFALPVIGEHLIFKGGTSLSKVFKVINRFSEDIDVSIDRGFLGYGGPNEPEAGASNKEKQRRVEALMAACQHKIATQLMPALNSSLHAKIMRADRWSLGPDESDPDKQTLLFAYPSSLPPTESGYVRRVVKIEMGARADHWPCETKSVMPYVAEQFPQGFRQAACEVKVLSVERTFWEKGTILHAEFQRPQNKPAPLRLSRHYCDFYELIRKGVAKRAVIQLDLLQRVAQHKNLFFKSSWAKYGEAKKGTLRIAPPEYRMAALRNDYTNMREMFFGEPPEFDKIITVLKQWESDFNRN
jgi:predicted nucleotidyltransferase component of viral defense system